MPATRPTARSPLAARHDVDLHRAIELARVGLPGRDRSHRSCSRPSSASGTRCAPAAGMGRIAGVIAYIPSPHSGALHVGPLVLHLYGLTLLVAIVACDLADRPALDRPGRRLGSRHARRGLGRRLRRRRRPRLSRRHVVERGAVAEVAGHLRGLARRARHLGRRRSSARSPARSSCAVPGTRSQLFMDAIAPGLLLAQGIGRIGNWWNQELFGKPTTLPWGLKIDQAHRPLQLPRPRDVPPDVPLRADLGRARRRGAADLDRKAASRSGRRLCSRSTSPITRSGASSRSCCASIRRTTSQACA